MATLKKVTIAKDGKSVTVYTIEEIDLKLSNLDSAFKTSINSLKANDQAQDIEIAGIKKTLGNMDTAIGNLQNEKVNRSDLLDDSNKVKADLLPSYVDDVLEYETKAGFPTTGESGKIYVAKDTNLTYRWSGTAYVEISPSLALGETSSTAYAGDKGKKNADDIANLKANKADRLEIPTRVSELENDAEYITKTNLANYKPTALYDDKYRPGMAEQSKITYTTLMATLDSKNSKITVTTTDDTITFTL